MQIRHPGSDPQSGLDRKERPPWEGPIIFGGQEEMQQVIFWMLQKWEWSQIKLFDVSRRVISWEQWEIISDSQVIVLLCVSRESGATEWRHVTGSCSHSSCEFNIPKSKSKVWKVVSLFLPSQNQKHTIKSVRNRLNCVFVHVSCKRSHVRLTGDLPR